MPCQNGGKCQQNGNFYVCLCINDYIGKNCEVKNTNSTILTNETTVVLNSLAGFVFKSLNLIYRASRDGFRAIDFHSKCDNTSNTLTLIKTKKSYIFGGYTTLSWNESGGLNLTVEMTSRLSIPNKRLDQSLEKIKRMLIYILLISRM